MNQILCYLVYFILVRSLILPFDKFVQIHEDAHTMLEYLTADQYFGLDAPSKVKHIVNDINNSALDTIKATIWEISHLGRILKGLLTYSRHLSPSRRAVYLGLITSGQHLTPNMVVVFAVVKGIKIVSVEAVAVVDADVLVAVDAVGPMDTKLGDMAAVVRQPPLPHQ